MDYSSKEQIPFKQLRMSANRQNASISTFLDDTLTRINQYSVFKKIYQSVIFISGTCREGKIKRNKTMAILTKQYFIYLV